jgi:imidazole glycerol phosphate synthase glutamine amidotransferase subunit
LEDTPLDPEWRRGVGANIHQAHFSATRQTLHWLSPNPYRAEVNLVRQSVSRMCCLVLGFTSAVIFGAASTSNNKRQSIAPRLGVRETLIGRIRAGVPFFGICLGMQALFECSQEAPEVRGFGLYPGTVRRFPVGARVPHMGWNQLEPTGRYVYFAHSYYVPETSATAARCTYTVPYTAVLEDRNVYGVQFHPEKSGPIGLQIVRNFLEI